MTPQEFNDLPGLNRNLIAGIFEAVGALANFHFEFDARTFGAPERALTTRYLRSLSGDQLYGLLGSLWQAVGTLEARPSEDGPERAASDGAEVVQFAPTTSKAESRRAPRFFSEAPLNRGLTSPFSGQDIAERSG